MNSKINFVTVIAVFTCVVFLLEIVAFVILVGLRIVPWYVCLFAVIPGIIELILLFSLADAIDRISYLENVLLRKGILKGNVPSAAPAASAVSGDTHDTSAAAVDYDIDVDDIDIDNVDLDAMGITFCKECDYQLFPEDEFCPYCGAKVDRER